MKIPQVRTGDGIGTVAANVFSGIDARPGARHGMDASRSAASLVFADMLNGSSKDFPLFSVRDGRSVQAALDGNPNGIGAQEALFFFDGTTMFYNGVQVNHVFSDEPKVYASLGKDLVIFPDKIVCETDGCSWSGDASIGNVTVDDVTYENCAFKAQNTSVNFADYFCVGDWVTISGCAEDANNKTAVIEAIDGHIIRFPENCFTTVDNQTIVDNQTMTLTRNVNVKGMETVRTTSASIGNVTVDNVVYKNCALKAENTSVNFSNYFRIGDAVTISGCAQAANNKTAVIRDIIDGYILRFSENCFTPVDNQTMTVRREVPDMDFLLVNENRLWGCKGDTIYASALGDVYNFNVFDGVETDSFAVDTGTGGPFTGACAFMGYPIFFKEDRVFKVYGNRPSNFEVMGAATNGVKAGCGKSLAIAGEVLYYVSPIGVCAYTGGFPTVISEVLGGVKPTGAVGGSDGKSYYLSFLDGLDEKRKLFVFDAMHGAWSKEDDTEAFGFASLSGELYMMTSDAVIKAGDPQSDEAPIPFMIETADITAGSIDKKGVSKIRLRFSLGEGAEVRAYVRYDSTGEWERVRRISDGDALRVYELPIIPRRCDHFRVRFEGLGAFTLYAAAFDYYVGSEKKSLPGRY